MTTRRPQTPHGHTARRSRLSPARLVASPTLGWLLLAIFFVVAWLLIGHVSAVALSVLILALYYAMAGASFNLLYGTLGVFSLCQPVFVTVGGYTDAYLNLRHGISPWVNLFAAMGVAAVLAVPIGYIAMRRSGTIVTALVTLIISEAAPAVLSAAKPLGGSIGMYLTVKSGSHLGDMQFNTGLPFARILLAMNVLLMAGLMLLRRSKWGYWTRAIKDSPAAASACGVPVARIRISVFVVSAMVAAVPGVVYAQYNLLVNADLFLGSAALFQVLVVALVGGSERPWGTLAGAVFITELSYYLSKAAGGRPGIGPLTFGVVFFLMALVLSRGMAGSWSDFWSRRR